MPLGANQYYVGENQQILPMYDKSKKTWSERLKITKTEKHTSPLEGISNCPPSALQRSMRYAEPWIYGTVRGIPARPVHGQSIFGPLPTEVAVVVCSCPEYLTGTKREVKKASICKKCRGSRLPLAPIGGTVRARPTIVPAMHKSRGNYGTMRLPSLSSVKSRPSILDPQSDPYDLMRRSRLLSPELKQADILVKPLRNRAKSTSPNRGRSRNNIPTGISIEDVALSKDNRSRSASRSKQDRWLDSLEPDPGGRRSILHCNVNPYDLISQTGIKHNNEFAPDHDDLFNSEQLKIIPRRQVEFINYSNSLNIAGQRISMGNSPKELLVSENNYTNLSVIKNKKEGFTQQELKQAKNNSNKKEAASEISKPKRPPRRKQESSFDNEIFDVHSKDLTISSNSIITPSSSRISADRVTSQKQGIKSILKRPSSVTSSISSSSDTDVKCSSDNHTNVVTNNDKKSVEINAKAEPQSRDDNKPSLKFYLPFPPARKKVQFMVENKIIHNEQEYEKGISKDSESVGNGNVNSNYDKVQKQQDNKMQQILDTFQESTEVKKICKNDATINEIKRGSKIVFKGGKAPGTPTVGGSRNTSDSCSVVHKTSDKTLGASSEMSPVQGEKDISATLSSPPSRRTYYSLRRVNSDRRSNTTTISLNFNDTMALRGKSSRTDCRDLFTNDVAENLIGIKSAEDSLPSHLPDSTASLLSANELIAQVSVNNDKTQAKGLGHQRQTEELEQEPQSPYQANKNISWQENGTIMIKNCPENYSSSEDERDKENSKSESTSESYTLKIDSNINVISFKKKNIKKQQDNKKVEKEKLLQAQTEIHNGARLFGNQINTSQKTIVRVAPFNKTPAEIHRLKISHKDDSQIDNSNQRKTSILINGDDCYSTVNVSNDTSLYQSSVVVADGTNHMTNNISKVVANTVTINVSHSRTSEEEIIYKNNKINTLLSLDPSCKAVIPIGGEDEKIVKETDDAKGTKRGRTLITLDTLGDTQTNNAFSHEEELVKILRNPVEAVRRNLVPHVCGRPGQDENLKSQNVCGFLSLKHEGNSFIEKLLEDPTLSHLAEGLDSEVVIKLIENSLKRLKHNRSSLDTSGTKDNDDMSKLIDMSLQKVKEERLRLETVRKQESIAPDEQESRSNRGSVSSANSFSSANYELFDFENNESDCYQSCSSEIAGDEDIKSTRNKFYQMLVDATLSEIEISTTVDDDHHYESIRLNGDPIYEEISDVPPPLPLSPPPLTDHELEKKNTRSMFEGATKYDILSYLVDAKERGIVKEDTYEYNFGNSSNIIVEEEVDTLADLSKKQNIDVTSRMSHLSVTSDSSEDNSLTSTMYEKMMNNRKITSDIERNDSGVGSETSKSSRSKFQNPHGCPMHKNSPIHICEDCDGPVETQITDSGVMYAPLVCRKCGKKRAERKEIITEIVETEEKYGRDLQIILEEFCQPMLVAGLLTQEQLSAIFLNTEELLENNQTLAERMRDALDIALDQGDDDLITVNIGKIFLEATPMLHAFETYCVRQASASLLLANLEKEKELLRIFLRVSQMENTVLRRMNLNSFLMVPVQRVTKYPLLLARLYKVTPPHLEGRTLLKQAQEKIELHLNHMNQETKDVPTKLWRRISSSSPNRRSSCEIDMINIKLRKMAIDLLEWNHDEVRFAIEGKLLFTQPTDNNWKKGRTIKLTPVNALLVTNGKPSANYKAEKALSNQLNFPKHTGIREASLLLVREKCGRYTLIREPLYMDRCVVCTEADWDDYFEVHEISSKDTFIFKAEDGVRTKQWYTQLQYHAQGMGAWRKRRNALANIMINGMLSRT